MKILNLYAGLGGNRRLWECEHVTAVENDSQIAAAYQDFFPSDTVIIADAHTYLEQHYCEYDFIWSSPPCPTHGQYRYNVGFLGKGHKAVYPDMKLYEEIIFLKHYFGGMWCVENVMSYYEPLITPKKLGRHFVWSNLNITPTQTRAAHIRTKNKISDFALDLSKYQIPNKRQSLRNCVDPELGLHILNCAKAEAMATQWTKLNQPTQLTLTAVNATAQVDQSPLHRSSV